MTKTGVCCCELLSKIVFLQNLKTDALSRASIEEL